MAWGMVPSAVGMDHKQQHMTVSVYYIRTMYNILLIKLMSDIMLYDGVVLG